MPTRNRIIEFAIEKVDFPNRAIGIFEDRVVQIGRASWRERV